MLRGDGARRCGAQRRDCRRVHDRERCPNLRIEQNEYALDCRQLSLDRILRDVRVDLDGGVGSRQVETRELGVQTPARQRQADRAAWRGSTQATRAERFLNRTDARRRVEELHHVSAIEHSHGHSFLTRNRSNDTVESMNDTVEATAQASRGGRRWLLFIHQLPPKPDYLRVKTRRRLRRLGAVAIKQTVYALPSTAESLEDLQWLRRELEAEGASVVIVEAELVDGISDEELDAMLASERVTVAMDNAEHSATDRVKAGRTWVTRAGVHVDRIASAWLIRRFIDPEARFKFVPARGYRA